MFGRRPMANASETVDAAEIHAVASADGRGIGYAVQGSGPPLVWLDMAPSHGRGLDRLPETEAFNSRLRSSLTVIRPDLRGFGTSDRTVRRFDLDRLVEDLAAVVDDQRLSRFSLGAVAQCGPVALAYAARYPQRVQRLLGWSTFDRGSVIEDSGFSRALRRFPPTDGDLVAATLAQVAVGWPDRQAPDIETVVAGMTSGDPSLAARVASVFSGAMSTRTWERFHLDAILHDARQDLPSLRTPTLLLFPRRSRMLSRDRPRQLAAAIAGSELRIVPGSAVLPFVEDGAGTADMIVDWALAE